MSNKRLQNWTFIKWSKLCKFILNNIVLHAVLTEFLYAELLMVDCLYVCCSLVMSHFCRVLPIVLCCRHLGHQLSLTCVVFLSRWTRQWPKAAAQWRPLVTVLDDWPCLQLHHKPYLVHDLLPMCLWLSHSHHQYGPPYLKMIQFCRRWNT